VTLPAIQLATETDLVLQEESLFVSLRVIWTDCTTPDQRISVHPKIETFPGAWTKAPGKATDPLNFRFFVDQEKSFKNHMRYNLFHSKDNS
jgi:hypothetical protein